MPYAKAVSPTHLPASVVGLIEQTRAAGQVLVLVTGVFDVLHEEHKKFLEKAKQAGDVLLVGLESDVRVTALKGSGRPINTEETRVHNLEAWHIADVVFVLPDAFAQHDDYVNLIETIRPQIMAVSANTPHIDRKRAVLALVGGEVRIVHDHNPAVSSTKLIQEKHLHQQ